jgi:ferrous iron transport protein B
MEMPPYKKPSLKNLLVKTWSRTKDFVFIAFPIIIVGSLVIEALSLSGVLAYTAEVAGPLMSGWLGLPAVAAIPLIFGILRKELTLILLSSLISLQSLSSVQMVVFSLVIMIYIPCLATIAAFKREFGWRKTIIVTFVDIALALVVGGIAYRLLSMFA